MAIQNELNSVATKILDKTINERHDVKKYSLHMRKIAKELEGCEQVRKSGIHLKPENPIELHLSPKRLNVATLETREKIIEVFEYIKELVEKLNEVSPSIQFEFYSLFFIGKFVRNEGNLVFKINWKLKK